MSSYLTKNSLLGIKVSKLFGFSPFTIVNDKCVTTLFDFLLFIGNLSIGSMFAYQSVRYRKELVSTNSEIVEVGILVSCVSLISVSLISMMLNFIFRKKIWNMILGLKEVDAKFSEIDAANNQDFYKKNESWFKFVMVVIVFITIPLNGAVYIIEKSLLKSGLYFYCGIYYVISVGSVCGIMNATRLRIKSINVVLESRICEIKIVQHVKSGSGKAELMRALMDIYNKLMEVYDSISICYGINAMLGFGFLFFYSIFSSFMAYKDFFTNGSLSGVTIVSLMFAAYLHLFMFSVIFLCTLTENEAQLTLKLSNQLLKTAKEDMEVAMLISFSAFVRRRLPKFTCGLFDFDWSLIYSVS